MANRSGLAVGLAALALAVGVGACGGKKVERPVAKPVAATSDKPAPATEDRAESARDPEVLQAHHDYQDGITAIDDGRPDDAIDPLERALAVYDGKLAEDDARLADTLHMLVQAYRGVERYKDAELTARKMLELVRRVGPRTTEVTALNQLGLGFYEAGDAGEASRAWEAAAAVQTDIGLGYDDADVRVIRRNIALAYGDLGRHEEAIDELRRVLVHLQLGEPHSLEAANTMYMLAGEYNGDDAMDATALDLYTKAVDIYTVELEPDSERLMDALAWKGSLMWTGRDLAGARDVYQQVLKIRMRDGLRDHDVAIAYADLGVVEVELQSSAVAIIHLDQSIEILREEAEPDLNQILTLLSWRSRARVQHKDFTEADADADAAIRMAIDLWGPKAKETLDLIESVASGYTDFKQPKRAKAFRARAKKLVRAD